MYTIDFYDNDCPKDAKRMVVIIDCLINVYAIGMIVLIYFCIFPNSIFIIKNNN